MVEKITSVNNEQVKEVCKLQQKKYREESGLFILEGYKAIKEAYDFGIEIIKIFVDEKKVAKYNFCEIIEVTEPVLKKLSTTDSAPEAVAVARQKVFSEDVLKTAKKVALLEGVKDAGNLGTILRSAVAFSLDAIVLYGDTIDLYNPKVVRASVGNLWKIPVIKLSDLSILKDFQKVATLPKSEDTVFLNNFDFKEPCVIMFGSEADGLSAELIDIATDRVTIEMSKNVESLNLSVSASVIFYKLCLL